MVTGKELARVGVDLAQSMPQILYSELDCQAFMEKIFSVCGQKISYRGSNDMYRNACSWVGTLSEAKRLGYLVPGAALFIQAFDGGEGERYKSDGKGNASHVGMYVGENALEDDDKNGKARICNVVHSSASMGRVAGSTLKNAWTHVGLWKNVDFGLSVSTEQLGGEEDVITNTEIKEIEYGVICTENEKPVNFRKKASKKGLLIPRMPKIPNGGEVQVNYYTGEWANVTYKGYTGFVMSEFIQSRAKDEDNSASDQISEGASRFRLFIDFDTLEAATAFQDMLKSCQIESN